MDRRVNYNKLPSFTHWFLRHFAVLTAKHNRAEIVFSIIDNLSSITEEEIRIVIKG